MIQAEGVRLLHWLGERDRSGLDSLRGLLTPEQALVALPLLADAPTDLERLSALGDDLARRVEQGQRPAAGR